VREHRVVVEPVALAQREELVEPEAGEVGRPGGGQVRAAPLDPDRAPVAPEVVALDELRRRVAAAAEDERAVGADQTRARDEPLELRAPRNRRDDRHGPMLTGSGAGRPRRGRVRLS
jgi:hypothetical protein